MFYLIAPMFGFSEGKVNQKYELLYSWKAVKRKKTERDYGNKEKILGRARFGVTV